MNTEGFIYSFICVSLWFSVFICVPVFIQEGTRKTLSTTDEHGGFYI